MAKRVATKKRTAKTYRGKPELYPAEYLQDHNATQAAIRCGYSPSSAAKTGARLSRKYHTQIQKKIAQSNARLEVTADRIRQELAQIAYLPLEGIASFQLRAKVKCLEILAKHSGMLVERHEVQGTGESNVNIYIPDHDRSVQGVARADEEGLDDAA